MFSLSAGMSHQLFMSATVKSKMSHQLFMLETVKRQTLLHLPFKINLLFKYLTELNVQIQAFMHKQCINITVYRSRYIHIYTSHEGFITKPTDKMIQNVHNVGIV